MADEFWKTQMEHETRLLKKAELRLSWLQRQVEITKNSIKHHKEQLEKAEGYCNNASGYLVNGNRKWIVYINHLKYPRELDFYEGVTEGQAVVKAVQEFVEQNPILGGAEFTSAVSSLKGTIITDKSEYLEKLAYKMLNPSAEFIATAMSLKGIITNKSKLKSLISQLKQRIRTEEII